MQEKSFSNKTSTVTTLEDESISLLEWDSLKTHLSSFSSTEMGRESILNFQIPSEYDVSKRLLNETVEITQLENNLDQSISFSDVFDIRRNIEICSKGGVILSSDLFPARIILGLSIIPVKSTLCKISSSKHFLITSEVFS